MNIMRDKFWIFTKAIHHMRRRAITFLDNKIYSNRIVKDTGFQSAEFIKIGGGYGGGAYFGMNFIKLSNVKLARVGGRTFVVSGPKVCLRLSAPLNYKQNQWEVPVRRILNAAENVVDSTDSSKVLYLPDYYSNNYYHWLVEFIPFVPLSQWFGVDSVVTICPELKSSFQQETLNFFAQTRWKKIPEKSALNIETLYIPAEIRLRSKSRRFSYPNPFFVKEFSNLVRQEWFSDKKLPEPDIVLISRRQSDGRRLINEDEVVSFLSKRGYDVVLIVPEGRTVYEQAIIVANAKIIIGPHGAGLSNLIFSACQKIIEIVPRDHVNVSFESLAYSLGIQHELVLAKATSKVLGKRSDMYLDPAQLLPLLD